MTRRAPALGGFLERTPHLGDTQTGRAGMIRRVAEVVARAVVVTVRTRIRSDAFQTFACVSAIAARSRVPPRGLVTDDEGEVVLLLLVLLLGVLRVASRHVRVEHPHLTLFQHVLAVDPSVVLVELRGAILAQHRFEDLVAPG